MAVTGSAVVPRGREPGSGRRDGGVRMAPAGAPRHRPGRESASRPYPRALPIVPVRARGLTIEGADGRRYLDCLSGAGTLALGHNHPVVLEAIRRTLDSGAPLQALDLATPVRDAFVAELLRTLPPGLADRARVEFCGPAAADAVRAASRLVHAATGRAGLLTFTGACRDGASREAEAAYGTTAGAFGSRGARPPYPRDQHGPSGTGAERGAAPTGAERGAALVSRWAEPFPDDAGAGAALPAGLLLEPVHDEGGVIPAPDPWMRRMRELTRARSVPLVVDEEQTGVGRTGTFWGVEPSGITPDAMILSKAVGGSLPLSVLVHDEALGTGRTGEPPGGCRGNQLAMAAGTATLAYVRENRLAERAAVLGDRLLGRLRRLADDVPCIADVRGRGLLIGVELVHPEAADTGPPPTAPGLASAVQRECLRRGLIVELGGPGANVVRLLPPLTITDEQLDAVLDRLADAVTAVAGQPPPSGPAPLPGSGSAPSPSPRSAPAVTPGPRRALA
ncbi:aminotransferase class III-fold pyridoxal phosphate-dependent enzyme [Streptomyces sp. NPDC059786]|uniref:aminotransferase class III-fold pyridoxal phosphate-dependent enzyme n=1 Tax=Streptomyces sp. NPDC059786 TaxID=3346946 RepID=UPI00366679E0